MKRIAIIILLFAGNMLYAEDKISAGLTTGYQYDTGMLSDKGGLQAEFQQNISIGVIIKLDMGRLFLRSGIEYSYPFAKGDIKNSSAGDVEETAIAFLEAPIYGGINLSLRDFGAFYLGGGGSYIFGSGYVETSDKKEKISEQLFGYGIIAGIESEIYSDASFMFEWEYVTARCSPVASRDGLYDNYSIDYSGCRVRMGVMYHFSRY